MSRMIERELTKRDVTARNANINETIISDFINSNEISREVDKSTWQ